mgnify:CR=1 FL=1
MMKRLLAIIAVLLSATFAIQTVSAQCTVKGTLFDDSNGEAIPFANVVLDGTRYGCATDLSGFFLINKVPAGTYTLRVRYMGYEEYRDTVVLADYIAYS